MATYTEKLGLKLPSQTDFYNVDDFNENFRKLDQNTAQGEDIQQVLTLADPIRSNRAPTTADKQYAGKLWVVPKMIFNNMMPNALTQVASNWKCTASTSSVSGSSATIVGDGTASTIVSEVDMTAVRANDIVYINAKMAVTADANGATIELLCGDDVIATTSMSIPTAGNSTQLIGHTKVDAAGALKLRVTTMYNSASAQLGKGVTISDITILDLTADMCQNFAGIEFSKDAATTYINTYGNFQTKIYELSECWWICRGSYGGQYSWQRYDDYTNAVINKYSTDYQNSKATTAEAQAGTNDAHWMTPLKSQQFLTAKIATTSEAQAGTDNTKVMTPVRVANQIAAKIATTAEAQAGTNDTKIMTPLKVQQFLTNRAATDAEVATGTVTNKWTNPKQVSAASKTVLDGTTGKLVQVYTGFDHFGTWRWTQAESRIDYFYGHNGSPNERTHAFRWGNTRVLLVGWYGNNSTYAARHVYMNLETGTVISQWDCNTGSDYHYSANIYTGYNKVSCDGSLVISHGGTNSVCITDMATGAHFTVSGYNFNSAYKTSSRWGYIYYNGYSDRRAYYANTGSSAATSNYYDLGDGNSSYGSIHIIGVHGSYLWFADQQSQSTWRINKIDMSNGSLTLGVLNLSYGTSLSLSPITHDGVRAYLRVNDSSGYNTYALIVDMSNGTSNWDSIKNAGHVSANNDYNFVSNSYYAGSTADAHWCVSQYCGVEINRTTGALTVHNYPVSMSNWYNAADTGGFMMLMTLNGQAFVPIGKYLYDPSSKTLAAMFGDRKPIFSRDYVSGAWYGYYGPNNAVSGFGGTVTTPKFMSLATNSTSPILVIGGDTLYSGVQYAVERN